MTTATGTPTIEPLGAPDRPVSPPAAPSLSPPATDDPPAGEVWQRLDVNEQFPYSTREYVRKALWFPVQATLFRLPIPRALAWRRWLLRAFGARLGRRCGIGRTARFRHPWLLEVGDDSFIADRVDVYNLGPIRIGRQTIISQDAVLCAGTHDYTVPTLPLQRPPIVIGSGVWVCAGAFVGPGVTIGDNAVIGARACVFRDIPPGMIAGGNPAKVLKPRVMKGAGASATIVQHTPPPRGSA